MLKRALFGCLLAVVLSACAGGPAIFGPSTGTVSGHVSVRACGGAYRLDQPGCPTQPVAGARLSFRLASPNGTHSDRTATTDAAGAYTIALPPSNYTVTVTTTSNVSPKPRQVTVLAGKSVTVDFVYSIELL
jgi:hypothetical protein